VSDPNASRGSILQGLGTTSTAPCGHPLTSQVYRCRECEADLIAERDFARQWAESENAARTTLAEDNAALRQKIKTLGARLLLASTDRELGLVAVNVTLRAQVARLVEAGKSVLNLIDVEGYATVGEECDKAQLDALRSAVADVGQQKGGEK
jgi:hypothetical protein